MRGNNLHAPSQQYMVPSAFVDRVDDAIVFNSITEVCISFDDDPLRAELSPAKKGTGVKIGESAVEQGN